MKHNFSVQVLKIISFFSFILLLSAVGFPKISYAYSKTPFIKPMDGEIIVTFRQVYLDKINNVERKHTGIDIEGSWGDKVFAAGNGIVSYTGISPVGGRTIVIKHNEKIRSTYLNLKQVHVSCGVYINQGDNIGTIGAADDPSSDAVHLHFGIIYNNDYLNPGEVLEIDYGSISKYMSLKYIKQDSAIKID